MYTFPALLSRAPSGLYRLAEGHTSSAVRALCRLKRVELRVVSAEQARSKERFLAAVAHALSLPRWFGMNWDALTDCLTDFAWEPDNTHVLLLSHIGAFARSSPVEFGMALAVLEDATAFWAQQGVRFLVLLESKHLPRSVHLPSAGGRVC